MSYEESLTVRIGEFSVFPYKSLDDALSTIDHAKEHFEEQFKVRRFHQGYILASATRVLDTIGFVVDQDSPLDKGPQTFFRILRESLDTP
jgi:hypothetical protein